jgi:tetratricopeptide (TPR) repeat protein
MYMGFVGELVRNHKDDAALEIINEVEKSKPTDPEVLGAINAVLLSLKRYPDALEQAESAVKSNPDNAGLLMQLADARIHTGNPDGGATSIEQAVAADSSPNTLNSAAYTLGDNNVRLDEALKYAQRAVTQLEYDSATISLDDLATTDKVTMNLISATWDTLGWIDYRLGHYDQAEKYCRAAWAMYQDAVVADHLGQIYEKMSRKMDAIQAYKWALDAENAPDETNARLKALTGGKLPAGVPDPGVISTMRTVSVARILREHASAEFFLLAASDLDGPKIVDVRFTGGSDALKDAGAALKTAKFDLVFPDNGPTHLLLHGVLDCERDTGCSFVLLRPDAPSPVE